MAASISLAGCIGGVGNPLAYNLTVEVVGEGNATPGVGTHEYVQNVAVSLSATPKNGWSFSHWEGPVAESLSAQTTVVIDGQITVRAVFKQNSAPIFGEAPGGLITQRSDGSRLTLRPGMEKDIRYILIHAMSDSAANPTDPFRLERIRYIFNHYKVEAHYVIDRMGIVHQFVEDMLVARHAGLGSWAGDPRLTNNMNRYAVGIELLAIGTEAEMSGVIGTGSNALVNDDDRGYTDDQYQALLDLVRYLSDKYRIPGENIIGHDDYDPNRKWDPGALFDWERIALR